MKKAILHIIMIVITCSVFGQNVFTVIKSTDVDPFEHPFNNDDSLCDQEMYGTLRWAINKVNSNTGESVILFDIVGTGVQEIVLTSFLPQLTNNVTIDGTSQNGYTQENPTVKINGYLLAEQACFNSYKNVANIDGIWFYNFSYNVLYLYGVSDSEIKNILITNNLINSTYSFAFSLNECNNILIYNNIIEDELDNENARNYSFGYYLKNSNNIIIGGTEDGQANTIKNCNMALYLVVSQQIKISGNKIYNNNVAMTYIDGSNNYIDKPIVYAYTDGVLNGTALPNSTIEVFGSTGEENANEYLMSTVADVIGDWYVELSTEYEHFLVTQTDDNNNTSTFGNILYSECEVPIDLSASEGISTSHTLSWIGPAGATFNVAVGRHGEGDENWLVSFTPNITENYITITGLDENTVYEFMVNANCGTVESQWALPYAFNVPLGQNAFTVIKSTDVDPFEHPFNNDDNLCDQEMYGTLQWAINKANYAAEISTINFNIPGSGIQEISLISYLPQINKPVIIDATTQPGYTLGNPMIKINGQDKSQFCFNVYNTTVTIKGLHMANFISNAILLNLSNNSKVLDNEISNIFAPGIGIQVISSNYVEMFGNKIS